VFVEETRNLKSKEGKTSDPIVEVQCFGDTKFFGPKKKVGNGTTFWGEHFFFNKKISVNQKLKHFVNTISRPQRK